MKARESPKTSPTVERLVLPSLEQDAHVDDVAEGQAPHHPPSLPRIPSSARGGGFTQSGTSPRAAISLVPTLVARTRLPIA